MKNYIFTFFMINTNNIEVNLFKNFSKFILYNDSFHFIKEISFFDKSHTILNPNLFFFKTLTYDFISAKLSFLINNEIFKSILTLGNINFSFYSTDMTLENFLRNLSFGLLFFSMLYFWMQTAFKSLTNIIIGDLLILTANLSLSFLLLLRWKVSGHFPLSNLYESLMFLSWSCTGLYFLMVNMLSRTNLDSNFSNDIKDNEVFPSATMDINGSTSWTNSLSKSNQSETNFDIKLLNNKKQTISLESSLETNDQSSYNSILLSFSKQKINALNTELQKKIIGCITLPVALLMNAYATFNLPSEMQQASPLVPALQSNWLMMHVTVMILSYAALILGSLLSMAFLIFHFFFNKKSNENKVFKQIEIQKKDFLIKIIQNLDNYSYRIIGIGFSLLTIGILSGAVWANEAWGSYWSWDPKETWAFLTWLVYAIYLHTRITKGWQGQKPAIVASVGFIMVWICFLGVNLIGKGLHSYGFFN